MVCFSLKRELEEAKAKTGQAYTSFLFCVACRRSFLRPRRASAKCAVLVRRRRSGEENRNSLKLKRQRKNSDNVWKLDFFLCACFLFAFSFSPSVDTLFGIFRIHEAMDTIVTCILRVSFCTCSRNASFYTCIWHVPFGHEHERSRNIHKPTDGVMWHELPDSSPHTHSVLLVLNML